MLRAWELAGCPGRLVIAGGAPPAGDGVDVGAMVADIVSSPETVEVIGEVGDIAPFLAAADVLVLPSDEPEPFGLVVIEAFSMGRPVIASRAGGVVDIIDEGENGWFFEMGDAGALAARLAGLAGEDVARAGLRAREAYERSYRPELLRARLGTVVRRAFSGEHVRGRERLPGPPA